MYHVFRAPEYKADLSVLDNSYRDIVYSFERKLKENPTLGKPLTHPQFKEKRFNGRRMLYLVYPHLERILLVKLTDKRSQRQDIDFVLAHLREFEEYVKKL